MTDENFQKGINALNCRNFDDAIIHFTNALKVEKDSSTFYNRAFAYMNLGKFDLAKSDYEAAANIISQILSKLDKSNKTAFDSHLRDLIYAKATIGKIEMEHRRFNSAILLYTELIELYKAMSNNSILKADTHISRFYSERSMANMSVNQKEEGIRDMAMAYVEANTNSMQQEILMFAQMAGVIEKVKQFIILYSRIKKENQNG